MKKKRYVWTNKDVSDYQSRHEYTDSNVIGIDIGIDPGRHVGLAIHRINAPSSEWIALETLNFWQAHAKIEDVLSDPKYFVRKAVIEDPGLIKVTFRRDANNMKTNDRKSRNVGMPIENARIWCEYFAYKGVPVIPVKPGTKPTKLTAVVFSEQTGTDKHVASHGNEHGRDAGCLLVF